MLGRVSDIDLRYLRVFAAVVESGGFSLAAAKLNLAESTISSHMSDLEARLNIRLCERGRAGFRLTRNGEEVYKAFLELADGLELFRDTLASVSTGLSAIIRVGIADAIQTNTSLPLVDCVRSLAASAPDLIFEFRTLGPRELERHLLEESIHVSIGPKHREIAGLKYFDLVTERNYLYCAQPHELFDIDDDTITTEQLEKSGLISRGYLDRFDEKFFSPEAHSAIAHHIEAASLLVQTGRYAGFLPDHYAEYNVQHKKWRAIKPQSIFLDVPFALSFKRTKVSDLRIRKFVEAIQKHISVTE